MIDLPTGPPQRFEKEGNPFYPLPPDYDDLNREYRRVARVNALRLQKTPDDMVQAWSLLRDHYLMPLPDGVWYPRPMYSSPPAHYRLVWDVGNYARNVQVYPRAFAKSTVMAEICLLWMLTRPFFSVLIIKAADDFVHDMFTKLMWQIVENSRILEDFGCLKPKKGSGIWSMSRMKLANGFSMTGRSIMSRLPGFRPRYIWVDDAEFDPGMRVSPTVLTENFRYTFFSHMIPMLEAGSGCTLIGTFYSRRLLIYHLATCTEIEEPRARFFNRVALPIKDPDTEESLWPGKWSDERIEEIRMEVGAAVFAAQYMNRPGTEDEKLLKLDPLMSYYSMEDPPSEHPLESPAILTSYRAGKHKDRIKDERPSGEVFNRMYRLILADPIRKPSATSDFACVMVVGVERTTPGYKDSWWVLDMRLGRVKESKFMDWIWELGNRWEVRAVGIEAVSTQQKLVDRTQADFAERAMGTGWMPKVLPLRYIGDFAKDKASRISGIAWRFEQYRIRLPGHLMHVKPWTSLLDQIENFTEDLKLLSHDDAIDTLAMTQFAIRPRSGMVGLPVEKLTDMELLAKGYRYHPDLGYPLMLAVNLQQLSPEAMDSVLCDDNKRGSESQPRQRRGIRLRSQGRKRSNVRNV